MRVYPVRASSWMQSSPMNERSSDSAPSGSNPAAASGVGSTGMKSRAIRASVFTIGGYSASQVLRIGSNMTLTRLLFPEAFGVMALVQVLQTGLEMLSDIGIQPSIIQNRKGEERAFLDSAWTIQVIRGFVLWICGCLLASPFAWFYDNQQMLALVPVVTAGAVISGLNSTKLPVFTRRMHIGPLTAIDLVSQVTGIALMIGVALVYRSVWALAVGGLGSSAMKMLLSHFALTGERNRFHWDPESVHQIVHFGKWIFLSTLVSFLAMRFDIFLLGRLVPIDLLGIYSIAGLLAVVPQQATNRLARAVFFPALAKSARESRANLAVALARSRQLVLPAGLLCIVSITLFAPAFFVYLYDERYHAAGWMAQLLMISVWFQLLIQFAFRVLLSIGHSRPLAAGNAVRLIFAALGCIVGFQLAGLVGLILGMGVGSFAGYLTLAIALERNGLPVVLEDARYTLVALGLGLVGGWSPHLLVGVADISDPTLLSLAIGSVIIAPLGVFVARRARSVIAQ